MLVKKVIQFAVLFSLCLGITSLNFVQAETLDTTKLEKYKTEANSILNSDIIPKTQVNAVQNGSEFTETNNQGEIIVKNVEYAGLGEFTSRPEVLIRFHGDNTTPLLPVIVSVKPAANIAKETMVNQEGVWNINIPVSVLPVGQNYAYIQTEYNGVKSDLISIASFQVSAEQQISEKTWYFIIFVAIAIITLLFAIILQLKRNSRDLAPGQLV